jgi:hypothetical protein
MTLLFLKQNHNVLSPSSYTHICICERFIYFEERSAYSAAGKYVDRSWEYVNRSQTHECRDWGWGRAIPRKGIHKWDFLAVYIYEMLLLPFSRWIPWWTVSAKIAHRIERGGQGTESLLLSACIPASLEGPDAVTHRQYEYHAFQQDKNSTPPPSYLGEGPLYGKREHQMIWYVLMEVPGSVLLPLEYLVI